MSFPDRKLFNDSFDILEQSYDSIRPGYPNKMYDDIKANINIFPASTILEIGSGSGTTIKKLAEFGCNLIGIESEENLVSLFKESPKRYPNISIFKATFEQYQPNQSEMDVIIAFTGFHWIKEEDKYRKVLALLEERGAFVLIWNSFLQAQSEITFDIEKLYKKYLSEVYPPNDENVNERVFRKLTHHVNEISDHPNFIVGFLKKYFSLYQYDRSTYPKLLNTYPKIISVEKSHREAFLNEVADAVSKQGTITIPVMTTVLIAQKKEMIINSLSF